MDILYALIGLVVGAAFAWLILRNKSAKLEERARLTEIQNNEQENQLIKEREEVRKLSSEIAAKEEENSNLQQKLEEHKKEVEQLENYIELERLRSSDPGFIVLETKGNFSMHTVPPMLFLSFAENAFKQFIEYF